MLPASLFMYGLLLVYVCVAHARDHEARACVNDGLAPRRMRKIINTQIHVISLLSIVFRRPLCEEGDQ